MMAVVAPPPESDPDHDLPPGAIRADEALREFGRRQPEDAAINGIADDGHLVLMNGPAKGGKTRLVADLTVLRLTGGGTWMGTRVLPHDGDAFIVTETHLPEFADALHSSGVGHGLSEAEIQSLTRRTILLRPPARILCRNEIAKLSGGYTAAHEIAKERAARSGLSRIDRVAAQKATRAAKHGDLSLHDYLVQREPGTLALLVFDSFTSCAQVENENASSEVAPRLQGYRECAQALQALTIVIHHTGHEQERARGSSAFSSEPDAIIDLRKPRSEGSFGVAKFTLRSFAPRPSARFRMLMQGKAMRFDWPDQRDEAGDATAIPDDAFVDAVRQVLKSAPSSLTTNAVRTKVQQALGREGRARLSSVESALDALLRAKEARMVPGKGNAGPGYEAVR